VFILFISFRLNKLKLPMQVTSFFLLYFCHFSLLKHQACGLRSSTHPQESPCHYAGRRLIPHLVSVLLKFRTFCKSVTSFLCLSLHLVLYASKHNWRNFIQLSYKFDAVISFSGFPLQTYTSSCLRPHVMLLLIVLSENQLFYFALRITDVLWRTLLGRSTCGLFNDAFSSSDYIALNGRMINE
jgi:hypothetical protein